MYSSFRNRVGPNPWGWYTATMRADKPRAAATTAAIFAGIMGEIIDHVHVLLRLGHGKAPGHALERSYRIG